MDDSYNSFLTLLVHIQFYGDHEAFVLVTGASTHSFPFSHRLQTSMQSSGLYMRLALANIPGMKD